MSETTPAQPVPTTKAASTAKVASAAKAASASKPASATKAAPAVPAPRAAKRVLVAEDEAIIRLDLAEMLVEAGYDVVGQAGDGEQAVALATSLRPDIVIMDVKMPVMDGISAAEQIGKERICPVVMLTAFSQTELVERARDAGVMAYIVKPFTSSDVTPALDIALSRWAELKTLEAEIADLGDRLETRKAVDRAKGVLMTKLKISEADAFRWIQKTAMDRRMSMREVADAVVAGMEKA
jgi:AmiR/NasT family two-component response regulator